LGLRELARRVCEGGAVADSLAAPEVLLVSWRLLGSPRSSEAHIAYTLPTTWAVWSDRNCVTV